MVNICLIMVHVLPYSMKNFRTIFFSILAITISAQTAKADRIGPDGKKQDCYCREYGKLTPVGTVSCLQIGGNSVLAQCEMVLNNPNWKILGKGCPVAFIPKKITSQ